MRARELRKKEVWLEVPPRNSDTETGSETEVKLHSQTPSDNPDGPTSSHDNSSSQPSIEITAPNSASVNPDLPDAVSGSQTTNLPDLVTSSPKLERRSSDSECFASLEDLRTLTVRIPTPDSTWLEVEAVLSKPETDGDQPIVMVTAATPTAERPPETRPVEPTRLVVPKEKSPVRQQPESHSSFDSLIMELRQRKAKNKAEAEARESLKPLATETARLQMSKYFGASSKNKEQYDAEGKVMEPQMSSKVSEKFEKKNMMKYFGGSSFESNSSVESRVKETNESSRNDVGTPEVDVLDGFACDDLDIDDIEREFNAIEQQNKDNLELLESVEISGTLPNTDVDLFNDYVMVSDVTDTFKDEYELASDDQVNIPQTKSLYNTTNKLTSHGVELADDHKVDVPEILPLAVTSDISTGETNPLHSEYKSISDRPLELISDTPVSSYTKKSPIDRATNGSPINTIPEFTRTPEFSVDNTCVIPVNQLSSDDFSKETPKIRVPSNPSTYTSLMPAQERPSNDHRTTENRLVIEVPGITTELTSNEIDLPLTKQSTADHKSTSPTPTEQTPACDQTASQNTRLRTKLLPSRPTSLTKLPLRRITVHQPQLLSVRITEVRQPERLSAHIENIVVNIPADDTPKRPGRRRTSPDDVSSSQPSSPLAPVCGNKSDLRKSLSTRLQRKTSETPGSPVPDKRHGLLSRKVSFKSVDSSGKTKKDKCVIS